MEGTRKIMVKRRDKMSETGRKQWSKGARRKLHPYVYRNLGVRHAPYSVFKERKILAEWIEEQFGYGHFYLFIWRAGYYKKRSVKRLRPYRIAEIEISESKPPNFIDLRRISKFKWFEPSEKLITDEEGIVTSAY